METVFLDPSEGAPPCQLTCADVHIRRLVVKAIASHHDFFYLLFKRNLAMTYGLDRDPPEVLQERIRAGTISAQDLREHATSRSLLICILPETHD